MAADYTMPWHLGDLVLTVQGKPIYSCRAVLSVCSQPFHQMLTQEYYSQKGPLQIELPGKKYQDVLELVKVTHPPPAPITEDNCDRVLPLAFEYQMAQVLNTCEMLLLKRPVSLNMLQKADKYCLPQLQRQCISQISDDLETHFRGHSVGQIAQEMDDMQDLSSKSKYELMGAKARQCERDVTMLRKRAQTGGAELKYQALQVGHKQKQSNNLEEKVEFYESRLSELCSMVGQGTWCASMSRGKSERHLLGQMKDVCDKCRVFALVQELRQSLPAHLQKQPKEGSNTMDCVMS